MSGINPVYLEKLKKLRLMDDDFMCAAFKYDPAAVKEVLAPIMKKEDLIIQNISVQGTYTNLRGHSVRLDVTATDSFGSKYDIEIQRADHGAAAKRARYNLGLLDSHNLNRGDNYDNLPETWIIFITENDVLKNGYPMYHIERIIQETGELFNDAEHIIYVNGDYHADDPIGRLMADFRATNADEINSPVLSDKVRVLKETEEGQRAMCKLFEKERTEGALDILADMIIDGEISLKKGRERAQKKGYRPEDLDDYLRKEYPSFNLSNSEMPM